VASFSWSNFQHKLFVAPTQNLWLQLLRYFFVGGFAFVLDATILFSLTEFAQLHYRISAACGFLAGLVFNYLISVRWVFSQRNVENAKVEFLVFAVVGGVGLVMNDGVLWFCTEYLGFKSLFAQGYMLSKIVAAAIVFLFNFFARKLLLFRSASSAS